MYLRNHIVSFFIYFKCYAIQISTFLTYTLLLIFDKFINKPIVILLLLMYVSFTSYSFNLFTDMQYDFVTFLFLKSSQVYHLEGGILKYLEIPDSRDREPLGRRVLCFRQKSLCGEHGLVPGNFKLCYGCKPRNLNMESLVLTVYH